MATKKAKAQGSEFAVIETGGKQYRVSAGDLISVEKLAEATKVGDKVRFGNVLLVDNGTDTSIGTPYIQGAEVNGIVTEVGMGKKVTAVKYKAKSNRTKKFGHRQPYVKVSIESIS